MVFEQALANAFSQRDNEKTFIDKLLSKDDIATIKVLMKKEGLTRSELLELLYMLTSSESKLSMFGDYERYVLMKYFVWVREFVKITELHFDYLEDLNKKKFKLSPRSKKLLQENKNMLEHQIKFLVDMFLMISRSSLSRNGAAFGELLKQRFEIQYSDTRPQILPQNQQTLRGGQ